MKRPTDDEFLEIEKELDKGNLFYRKLGIFIGVVALILMRIL